VRSVAAKHQARSIPQPQHAHSVDFARVPGAVASVGAGRVEGRRNIEEDVVIAARKFDTLIPEGAGKVGHDRGAASGKLARTSAKLFGSP
jgi:hypothetical protein